MPSTASQSRTRRAMSSITESLEARRATVSRQVEADDLEMTSEVQRHRVEVVEIAEQPVQDDEARTAGRCVGR